MPWLEMMHTVCFRPLVERAYGPWDDDQQRSFFETEVDDSDEILIVEHEDTEVGAIYLIYRDDETYLESLEVHPDYQCQGIGSTVLQWIADRAKNVGQSVVLQVHKLNDDARRLYVRNGFVEEGQTPTHIVMRRTA